MEKSLVIFQPARNVFGLLTWKKAIIFQTYLFTCIFIIFNSTLIINFTFIMLTIMMLVFDLGMSFGKVEKGLEIYIQNCVGTLTAITPS